MAVRKSQNPDREKGSDSPGPGRLRLAEERRLSYQRLDAGARIQDFIPMVVGKGGSWRANLAAP